MQRSGLPTHPQSRSYMKKYKLAQQRHIHGILMATTALITRFIMWPRRPGPPRSKAQKVAKAACVFGRAILVTLTFPFLCVYLGMQSLCDRYKVSMPRVNRRVQAPRHRAEQKRILEGEAPRLLGKRKRALTLPLPDIQSGLLSSQLAQCTGDQLQSVWFGRFPYEIREMIYDYALTGFLHIHIFERMDHRLGHYICHSNHREGRYLLEDGYQSCCGIACKSSTGAEIWADDHISEVLPLLGTCRRLCVTLVFRWSGSN